MPKEKYKEGTASTSCSVGYTALCRHAEHLARSILLCSKGLVLSWLGILSITEHSQGSEGMRSLPVCSAQVNWRLHTSNSSGTGRVLNLPAEPRKPRDAQQQSNMQLKVHKHECDRVPRELKWVTFSILLISRYVQERPDLCFSPLTFLSSLDPQASSALHVHATDLPTPLFITFQSDPIAFLWVLRFHPLRLHSYAAPHPYCRCMQPRSSPGPLSSSIPFSASHNKFPETGLTFLPSFPNYSSTLCSCATSLNTEHQHHQLLETDSIFMNFEDAKSNSFFSTSILLNL